MISLQLKSEDDVISASELHNVKQKATIRIGLPLQKEQKLFLATTFSVTNFINYQF